MRTKNNPKGLNQALYELMKLEDESAYTLAGILMIPKTHPDYEKKNALHQSVLEKIKSLRNQYLIS